MSQRDLVAELRAARIEAPSNVRERVRLIAAAHAAPSRRLTWQRALVVALPVAAAVAAAVVFTTRPAHRQDELAAQKPAVVHAEGRAPTLQKTFAAPLPAPSRTRVQDYDASLGIRVKSPTAVSNGVQAALRIVRSFGGYESSVHVTVRRSSGVADLTVKVPRAHVREAVARLSSLGTVTSEQVDIRDVTATLNATDRTIARLQRQLAALRTQLPSESNTRRIAAFVREIQLLQRGEAAAQRTARFATVRMHLAAPAATAARPRHHGPLHDLVIALEWLGIGALYVVVLGAPVLLLVWVAWLVARLVRRRREDALLSS